MPQKNAQTLAYRIMHAIEKAVSCLTKFARTVWAINPTVPKSLKRHCRAAFIRKFSIIWRKSLPGSKLAHPRPLPGLSFTAALRARVPVAFASGGCSHCIRYLSGSFDILRQFAFGKLARRVSRGVSRHRSHGSYAHIAGADRAAAMAPSLWRDARCRTLDVSFWITHTLADCGACAMFIHKYTNEGTYKSD